MHTIKVEIGKDGKIEIEGIGFSGPNCAKTIGRFSDALGVTIEKDQKCEYWNAEVQQQQHERN